jgi:SAM-dependent methyltransferase
MEQAVLRHAQALYAEAPIADRLHILIRRILCPFRRLADFVPSDGLIVDLGCGHGLFANALALEAGGRRVVGVEPSTRKLAAARVSQLTTERIQFLQGDALTNPVVGPCRAILLIDVLYLLSFSQQERLLTTCFGLLGPGGVLLLKTMDIDNRWKATLTWVEEWLAVRVLGCTWSEGGRFAFRPSTEWLALCQAIGFQTDVVPLDQGYYHPHVAVVAVKR